MKEVISTYYGSDGEVAKDTELQAWLGDLQENGFPVGEGGNDHELPKSLATVDQLIHVLTCIAFTCSCQHAAVNFGLMDVAGFIPNTPHLSVARLQPRKTKLLWNPSWRRSQTSLRLPIKLLSCMWQLNLPRTRWAYVSTGFPWDGSSESNFQLMTLAFEQKRKKDKKRLVLK